jgi:hypothetical protein
LHRLPAKHQACWPAAPIASLRAINAIVICAADPNMGAVCGRVETLTMPWNSTYYPTAMKKLPPLVREKAIEIANALLLEGMDEGKAIRIAISKAKQWTRHHWGGS